MLKMLFVACFGVVCKVQHQAGAAASCRRCCHMRHVGTSAVPADRLFYLAAAALLPGSVSFSRCKFGLAGAAYANDAVMGTQAVLLWLYVLWFDRQLQGSCLQTWTGWCAACLPPSVICFSSAWSLSSFTEGCDMIWCRRVKTHTLSVLVPLHHLSFDRIL